MKQAARPSRVRRQPSNLSRADSQRSVAPATPPAPQESTEVSPIDEEPMPGPSTTTPEAAPIPPEGSLAAKDKELEQELTDLLKEYDRVKDRADEPTEPNLFDRPEQFEQIVNYQREIERPIEERYLEVFEHDIQEDALLVGAITLNDVQLEEKRLREAHLEYEEQEKAKDLRRREELKMTEEEVKRRLAEDFREKKLRLQRLQEVIDQQRQLAQDELHKSFLRSEQQLREKLEMRKGEVTAMYGDLQNVYGKFDGSSGRRWKVDWDNTPQPIQVKLLTVRGVRDKIPFGRYLVTVSLYNRLGGDVLRWSDLKGQYWGGSTVPTPHSGRFSAAEIKLSQSVFTVLPARPSIKPGMVLVFELYLLRGSIVPSDTVVGWGAFPICSGDFNVIEGKFKAPLLRGCMDPAIDKHDKIEEMIAHDLDNWLCNIYFQIIRLPRYQAGQREYEVELQFTSELLNFPDRIDTKGEDAIDGEDPQWAIEDVQAAESGIKEIHESEDGGSLTDSSLRKQPIESTSGSAEGSGLPPTGKGSSNPESSWVVVDEPGIRGPDYRLYQRQSYLGSRAVQLRRDGPSKDEALNLLYNLGEESESAYRPLLGEEGVYYKHHRSTVRDDYHEFLNSLLPETPQLRGQPPRRKAKLSRLQELEEHVFAVMTPYDNKGKAISIGSKRLAYVGRMFLSELGLSQWRSREFWLMLLMLLFSFFLRMAMHYVGQWCYLQAIRIPINAFIFFPYQLQLNYQPTLLKAHEEIAVVLMGPVFNSAIFVIFALISLFSQLILKSFPDLGSKFVLAFGTMTFLDPLLILIVDAILGRMIILGGTMPIGDAAKLYWHYERTEGSGLAGVILTLILYIFCAVLQMTLMYIYFLRLHNEGRMLDIYWRLHGFEENFFVPYDLEVSHFELGFLVKKAEQWRGEEGERRKIIVTDYVWEEEVIDDDSSTTFEEDRDEDSRRKTRVEITTHLAIHTVHLDGLKELFRHFLRLPDGSIIEVFGDNIGLPGMNEDMKLALEAGAKVLTSQPIPEVKVEADEPVEVEEKEKKPKKEKAKKRKPGNVKEKAKA